MFDFTLRGVDLQKLQDSLKSAENNNKPTGGRPNLFEGDCTMRIKRYAHLIQGIFDLSEEIGKVEGLQKEYHGLNNVSRKMLIENSELFLHHHVIPLCKVLMAQDIIDFGSYDYYNLSSLISFILSRPIDGNALYRFDETNQEYKIGELIILQSWFLLNEYVSYDYDMLETNGIQPDEPVATIENTLENRKCTINLSDKVLIDILNGLKEAEWKNYQTTGIGLVANDITDTEWTTAFTNPAALTRQLPVKAKFLCKAIVDQLLGGDYELGEKIFCYIDRKGVSHPIQNLKGENTYKREEICDKKNGLIAKIIQDATCSMDNKDQSPTKVQ